MQNNNLFSGEWEYVYLTQKDHFAKIDWWCRETNSEKFTDTCFIGVVPKVFINKFPAMHHPLACRIYDVQGDI